MSKMQDWYRGLSKVGKIGVTSLAVIVGLGTVGSFAAPAETPHAPAAVQSAQTLKKPNVSTVSLNTTESIPFTTTTVSDPTLDIGQTRVQTEGVDGVLTHTYRVTYTDGVETARSAPVDSVTTAPVTKVVAQGTRQPAPSCPNGTYVNTYGTTVCRPYESSSVPAGASAQCSDGTYSFSQSRSGTCSHHGGVAIWY